MPHTTVRTFLEVCQSVVESSQVPPGRGSILPGFLVGLKSQEKFRSALAHWLRLNHVHETEPVCLSLAVRL